MYHCDLWKGKNVVNTEDQNSFAQLAIMIWLNCISIFCIDMLTFTQAIRAQQDKMLGVLWTELPVFVY